MIVRDGNETGAAAAAADLGDYYGDETDDPTGCSDFDAVDTDGLPPARLSRGDATLGYGSLDNETILATAALFSGILWAASAGCLFYFVKSGRHAKWEEQHNKNGSDSAGTKHDDATSCSTTPVPKNHKYRKSIAVEMAPEPPSPGGREGGPTIATDALSSRPCRMDDTAMMLVMVDYYDDDESTKSNSESC